MIDKIEQIYRQHRRGLFTLALSITRQPDLAEDAVHEAIVRLCRAFTSQSGKSPTGDMVAYVYAAVRNAAVDQHRRTGGRAGSVSIFDLSEPSVDSDSPVEDAERDRLITGSIDALPADQREAVVMHLYTGLTFQQAAEALGVPLQTIASRYRRALSKLKEQLGSLK